ncbi:MAG: hypothetical protein HYT50_01010 [Candidatus Wildermuthbacteria bacterium]|nr:hypothetical protein [Candidatus Wildermuthbacteria bacterium]
MTKKELLDRIRAIRKPSYKARISDQDSHARTVLERLLQDPDDEWYQHYLDDPTTREEVLEILEYLEKPLVPAQTA